MKPEKRGEKSCAERGSEEVDRLLPRAAVGDQGWGHRDEGKDAWLGGDKKLFFWERKTSVTGSRGIQRLEG